MFGFCLDSKRARLGISFKDIAGDPRTLHGFGLCSDLTATMLQGNTAFQTINVGPRG